MEVDEVSYDILEWFPILYCQKVFKYLSGTDIIQASRVNKEWYKLTAEKQQAAKLQLVLRDYREPLNDEDKDILKNSERKYQNIRFRGFPVYRSDFYEELLADRAGSWKSVKIRNASSVALAKSIEVIEPTVEELEINEVKIEAGGLVDVGSKWTFPCLKSLKCTSTDYYDFYRYLYKCTNLLKLAWRTFSFRNGLTSSAILPVLRNNADLMELDVDFGEFTYLEHWSEFKFKLRRLHLFSFGGSLATLPPHLNAFLEANAQTLESLETNVKLNQSCLELILKKMPRLSSLTVSFYNVREGISDLQEPFPVNKTITTLGLDGDVSNEHLGSYQRLIRALTNLKNII